MLLRAIMAGLSMTLSASVAQAQDVRVVVPDAPSGAFISGCYRADRPLYGPYRLVLPGSRRGGPSG